MNIFSFFIFALFTIFPIYGEMQNSAGMVDGITKVISMYGGELQTHQCGIDTNSEKGIDGQCTLPINADSKCSAINNTNFTDIKDSVNKVLNYGVSEACECCKNPSKCAIELPGGVEKLLEGLGIVGGLVGTIGGVSKICKDVKRLQMALAGLNAWAGMKCQRRGRICSNKHNDCDTYLFDYIKMIDQKNKYCDIQKTSCKTSCPIPSGTPHCSQGFTCANYVLDIQNIKNTLNKQKNDLENLRKTVQGKGMSNCEFASKAGHTQVMQGAAFGTAAVISHFCQKSTEGGDSNQEDPCTVKDSSEYKTPRCQCKRGETPKDVDCCAYDSLSIACKKQQQGPCVNPNSKECICSQPGTQNLPLCREGSNEIPLDNNNVPIDEIPLDTKTPDGIADSNEFQFLQDNGEDKSSPFGGLPEIPPNLKAKSAFSPKTSKPNTARGGGSPSVSGGSLPSGGSGGLGGEGGDPEGEAESPYANLLDGLSGKQNQNGGAGGAGGFNSLGGNRETPFDLKKFLPKGKNRKPSSKNVKGGNEASPLNETIFQRASRITRVYCNKNQVDCTPSSK